MSSGTSPAPPLPRLSLGVTGHRSGNKALAANRAAVEAEIKVLFSLIDELVARQPGEKAPTRIHSLLADGADQITAHAALGRGWELVAPLPFGRELNVAINALPHNAMDADALLKGGEASDPEVQARASAIWALEKQAKLFELADQDELIGRLFEDMLSSPGDIGKAQLFNAHNSDQVALAARVMIQQSDLVVAVWDGKARNLEGGTGHTIGLSLELGTPVLVIDPETPSAWSIMTVPEALAERPEAVLRDEATLRALVATGLGPQDEPDDGEGPEMLDERHWRPHSSAAWTGYRRIEALFGGEGRPFRSMKQVYERPEKIAEGTGAALIAAARALPGGDASVADAIADDILPRFAMADGISAWLSDAYRSGMVANFGFSALAIMAGLAYQPLGFDNHKWVFALAEFTLLGSILFNTWIGGKLNWHAHWFETRRVAEYLRHAPLLLLLGTARPPGRWPQGKGTSWPEYNARHALRALGLPEARVTKDYLRQGLSTLLAPHVRSQRDYHYAKARRLSHVHHRLDRVSGRLFIAAVISVSVYLGIEVLAALHLVDHELPHSVSKLFTFLGVVFPTLAASLAGIRFFGDFERFAAISEVTAGKLDAIDKRIGLLLAVPGGDIDYASVAELAHAVDEVVVSEIENWQAVFGGKHIALPA